MISFFKSLQINVSILLTVLLVVTPASGCNSDRPGWATHRTLYVPGENIPKTEEEIRWEAALCCIYTHVERYDDANDKSWLELYDGYEYSVGQAGFVTTAKRVKDDVCKMSMGETDCNNKERCMDDALEESGPECIDEDDFVLKTKTCSQLKKKKCDKWDKESGKLVRNYCRSLCKNCDDGKCKNDKKFRFIDPESGKKFTCRKLSRERCDEKDKRKRLMREYCRSKCDFCE